MIRTKLLFVCENKNCGQIMQQYVTMRIDFPLLKIDQLPNGWVFLRKENKLLCDKCAKNINKIKD